MTFLPVAPLPRYLVFVGQCQAMPGYPDRYMAITIAGSFSSFEAKSYILEVLDGPVPSYHEFFQGEVHLRIMFFFAVPGFKVLKKIKYYLEYFTTVDYTSQYEWQIARHDLHSKICECVPPDLESAPLISGYLVDGPRSRHIF